MRYINCCVKVSIVGYGYKFLWESNFTDFIGFLFMIIYEVFKLQGVRNYS